MKHFEEQVSAGQPYGCGMKKTVVYVCHGTRIGVVAFLGDEVATPVAAVVGLYGEWN